MLMNDEKNVVYLAKSNQSPEGEEPDAIGTILLWANQMMLEGRMPENVQIAFNEHFSFFSE